MKTVDSVLGLLILALGLFVGYHLPSRNLIKTAIQSGDIVNINKQNANVFVTEKTKGKIVGIQNGKACVAWDILIPSFPHKVEYLQVEMLETLTKVQK